VKSITLKYLREALRALDPTLEGANYKTAVVLLAGLACGPDLGSLAKLTELPLEFIAPIRQRHMC
jgi:hypothetical protein